MSPFFSLIIPTYNSEKFISNCLKSVLNQKFSNNKYEIIIINDASNDKTLKVCNGLRRKNKTIKIINNKKNFGVSYSRNLGIKTALGKYVIFLDSDDTIKKNSLYNLKKLLNNDDVDLLLTYKLKTQKKKFNTKEINNFFKYFNSSFDFKSHYLYCWNYILKKNFLKENNIYFTKIRIFEDQVFVSKVLCAVNRIKVHNDSFHNHHERFDSLSRSMGFLPLHSCVKVIKEIGNILKNNNLTHEQKKFLHVRIDFMSSLFKCYLLVSNNNQIKIISSLIMKNINYFFVLKQKFIRNIILNKKNSNDIFKSLISFKKNIEISIINIDRKYYSSIYIFGIGILGRITTQILKKNNINTVAFLDNNKKFHNMRYLGLKILNPNQLVKFDTKKLKKILIIVGCNHKVTQKNICNQLKIYGLKSYNIKIINWPKNLYEL